MKLKERIQSDLCKLRDQKYIILSQKIRNIDSDLYNSIIYDTPFLDEYSPKLSDRLKYILNDMVEINKCSNCNSAILKIEKKYCSAKCNNNSEETKNKFRDAYNELSDDEQKIRNDKRTNTVNERYGGYTMQSDELSNKMRQTMMERYSVEHSFQNETSKQKAINTWIKKYGADNPFKAEKVKEKIKNILLEKYGVDNACNINSKSRIESGVKTKIERGLIIPDKLLSDYQKYRKLIKKLTEETYKKYKDIINPNNFKRVTNGNIGYQLDHRYSIFEGFLDDADPKLISSHHNLQMLEWSKNRKKGKDCSITLNELTKLVSNEI
jgi:hypothetical protein